MTTIAQEDAERRIASVIAASVGPRPILLCGSRGLGRASEQSDYDVIVVMPILRIPGMLGRLRRLARILEGELGSPISVSPLPASHLRGRKSLYLWKVRTEARVLAAPPGFRLAGCGLPALTAQHEFSYLASAAFYLLAASEAAEVRTPRPDLERQIDKALLHLVQVRLMRGGRYASTLDEALAELDDDDLLRVARSAGAARFFEARDAVVAELRPLLQAPGTSAWKANLRYVTLAALQRRSRLRALLGRRAIDRALAAAACDLLEALEPEGRAPEWKRRRDALLCEWPAAHPLAAQ